MFVTGKYRIFKFVCLSVIYKETILPDQKKKAGQIAKTLV